MLFRCKYTKKKHVFLIYNKKVIEKFGCITKMLYLCSVLR